MRPPDFWGCHVHFAEGGCLRSLLASRPSSGLGTMRVSSIPRLLGSGQISRSSYCGKHKNESPHHTLHIPLARPPSFCRNFRTYCSAKATPAPNVSFNQFDEANHSEKLCMWSKLCPFINHRSDVANICPHSDWYDTCAILLSVRATKCQIDMIDPPSHPM